MERGLRLARDARRDEAVVPLLAEGRPTAVLCEQGGRAAMVVVGARGAGGGIPGLLLGSVAAQVAAYAPGPVVVERGRWRTAGGYRPGPVAVGADGSADSLAALDLAAGEAELRGVPLLAVCALSDACGTLGAERALRESAEAALDRLEKAHPDITVTRHVTSAGPLGALLAGARDAQLIVVGRRGRGGVRGMRLGSVSQGLLSHALCPVAVTGGPRQVTEGSGR
jgi:nucleotide-binding universal stress UspA family protein